MLLFSPCIVLSCDNHACIIMHGYLVFVETKVYKALPQTAWFILPQEFINFVTVVVRGRLLFGASVWATVADS